MNVSRQRTTLRFFVALVVLLAAGARGMAGTDGVPCKLKIRGRSILQLTLIEKARPSGIRFDKPGETIRLSAGEYRVMQVELEGGYTWDTHSGQRQAWFEVSPEGPHELIVGAPLYPTATARRHGGFVQLDYSTVDGAGRSYSKTPDHTGERPPPPTFKVCRDGKEIGSGSFEYG